jgi:hypothetical protein
MEKEEAICNLEDIYNNYNIDEDRTEEHHTKQLLHDTTSKMNIFSLYCRDIYNYIVRCFFPSHINSLYQ